MIRYPVCPVCGGNLEPLDHQPPVGEPVGEPVGLECYREEGYYSMRDTCSNCGVVFGIEVDEDLKQCGNCGVLVDEDAEECGDCGVFFPRG